MQQTITITTKAAGNVYGQLLLRPAAEASAVWMPAPPARRSGLARHLAQRWDLYGILALMASSAAYGLFALTHLA